MTRKGTILLRSATANPRTVRPAAQWLAGMIVAAFLSSLYAAPAEQNNLVFFGDSITAGLGLDPDEAYPALVQKKIDAAGLPWRVVNAGLSGDTTAGGLRRLDWILHRKVSLIVIELGANDGLRGFAPEVTQANLGKMIERIRSQSPETKIVLAGMQMPTNLGPEYTKKFAAIYPALAKDCGVGLIPFLLAGVGGHPELNQGDGIHPTTEGQAILAANVWVIIEPLLGSKPPANAKP